MDYDFWTENGWKSRKTFKNITHYSWVYFSINEKYCPRKFEFNTTNLCYSKWFASAGSFFFLHNFKENDINLSTLLLDTFKKQKYYVYFVWAVGFSRFVCRFVSSAQPAVDFCGVVSTRSPSFHSHSPSWSGVSRVTLELPIKLGSNENNKLYWICNWRLIPVLHYSG